MNIITKIKDKINNRITYIDTVKCLAILMMLLGHILIYYRKLGNNHSDLLIFIYTFHMPVFFIISGILFNKKKWLNLKFKDFFISRIKTLIIPYLFLDISGGLLTMLFNNNISFKELLNVIKSTFSYTPNIGANWFLPAMFIGSIIFYLFMKYYKDWFKYLAFLPIIIIGINIISLNSIIIFINRGIIAFTFMYLGYLFKDYYLDDINKRWDIIILSLVLTITLSKWNGLVDIWGSLINNPLFMILGGLSGTYFLFGIAKRVDNLLFNFIGNNTITLMATHSILIDVLHRIFHLGKSDKSIIFLFIIITLIELPWMNLYDKYIPMLIGKGK